MTEKKNKSVMQEMKGAHNLDALHMDSIEINNQLTTREWVRMTDIEDKADYAQRNKWLLQISETTTSLKQWACT